VLNAYLLEHDEDDLVRDRPSFLSVTGGLLREEFNGKLVGGTSLCSMDALIKYDRLMMEGEVQ